VKRAQTKEKVDKEKYAVYMDADDLKVLREYQTEVGVPVSESIRRAVRSYIAELRKKD
jgi:hypothetical protein